MEVIREFKSTEEYFDFINKQKIDEVYAKAIDEALEKESLKELIQEAFTKVADTEAEMNILEDLFIKNKVDKKEVTQAKRRHTKAVKQLEELLKEEDKCSKKQ